jgi:phosphoglycolate phosphatase-like HAD superfamily hydrolase
VRKAGRPPHEVVMLGDTPYDVKACTAAGVDCIALRCGGWADSDLAGAVAVFADPAELLARYAESPLGPG